MGTNGDKTDVAMALTARLVVRLNDGESSVLTCCSRVGLERAGVETSDLAEVLFQFLR